MSHFFLRSDSGFFVAIARKSRYPSHLSHFFYNLV
nr:MAG TPA: hypothetical protein [Caudoviricetes sp.]